VAAYFVAGGWAAFAGLILVLTQRRTAVVTRRERAEWSLAAALAVGSLLAVIGLALVVYVAQRMTEPVDQMANSLLRIGYLGSAITVAGAAYLMMAVVLVSVHRVVPHSPDSAAAVPSPQEGSAPPAGP
jgi:hypothetical protein